MYEFGTRILLAGATILFAGVTGAIDFSLAVGIAIAIGLLAIAGHTLSSQDLYDGAGAGLHAALEGLAIAFLLTSVGRADMYGFLTLVPYTWAVAHRRASWAPGAIAAAGSLIAAHALLHRSDPPATLLFQAGGTLLIGMCLAIPTYVDLPLAEIRSVPEEGEIKGRFRALREAYTVLEQRSKENAHTAALVRTTNPDAMAQSLRDATSATGVVIYGPGDDGWDVLGSAGQVSDEIRKPARSARELQQKGATLLFAGGRPVGAVWTPSESRDGLSGVSDILSTRFSERLEMIDERRRRQAAELRVILVEGGDSPDAVAYALAATIGADSVEFGVVGPFGTTPLGNSGPPCGIATAMQHETGVGLPGWAAAGSPTVWIGDARSDKRVDGVESLRARTATFALVPLAEGRAYVWAAWHTPGSGRPSALSAMRAAEPVVVKWLEQSTGRTFRGIEQRLAA